MIRVYRDGGDWVAECHEHRTATWCTDWPLAMEAAYGHAAWAHKRASPAGSR